LELAGEELRLALAALEHSSMVQTARAEFTVIARFVIERDQ